ncbi:MAG TPA: type II toxin-antitoxin system VapC family toxin [Acidisphaera sp.]|nr:type II toxin-antitoxin system VapC family toxin [Acidisphaera sp.]
MRLLLDTHALLWWLSDDKRLGSNVRQLIADPGNSVLVSTVSFWEILVKVRVGKLRADVQECWDTIEQQGFMVLGITRQHLGTLAGLPLHHRDPFDHLLIAQAIAEGAALVSDDPTAREYPVQIVAA